MKTCCVDSAEICPNSSCSMVLRSACLHNHPHESFIIRDVQTRENMLQKRKSIKQSSSSPQIPAKFGSTFEHLTLKSNTVSFCQENCSEISKNSNLSTINGHKLKSVRRKLYLNDTLAFVEGYSQSSKNAKIVDNVLNIKEKSHYSTSSNMSRTRRFANRSSARVLSGSESEGEGSSYQNNVNHVQVDSSSTFLHLNSTSQRMPATMSRSSMYSTPNHHSSHQNVSTTVTEASAVATNNVNSTPQGMSVYNQRYPSPIETTYDRVRWFLWSNVYLAVISVMNFDVWLLSRVHRRKKAVLFLLPLFIYLFYSIATSESPYSSLEGLTSSLSNTWSALTANLNYPGEAIENLIQKRISDVGCPNLSHILYGIVSFLWSPLSKEGATSTYSSHTPDAHMKLPDALTKEEVTHITLELLEKKLHELKSPQYQGQEIKNIMNEFKHLEKEVHRVEKSFEHSSAFTSLNDKLSNLEKQLAALNKGRENSQQLEAEVEKRLLAAFAHIIGEKRDKGSIYYSYSQLLNEKITSEINIVLENLKNQRPADVKLDQNSMRVVETIVERYVEALWKNLTSFGGSAATYSGDFASQDVHRIVKDALLRYDADKTGRVDYALESGGGSVLSTRCSESYVEKHGKIFLFGFPFGSEQNTPRTAIQPDVHPGRCWAFKGTHGFLVIQLSYTIFPTGFTLEHIPVSISPAGSIDSAPKDFSVWGLQSENDHEGTLLGEYSYDINGDPLQYFPIKANHLATEPFSLVELKILTNHGNIDYTCLYRFRVHGRRFH